MYYTFQMITGHRDLPIANAAALFMSPNFELLNEDQVLEPNENITFMIEYPLTNPMILESHRPGGNWTRFDFVNLVQNAYEKIYELDAETGDYGVKVDRIEKLFLMGATRIGRGEWKLDVRS